MLQKQVAELDARSSFLEHKLIEIFFNQTSCRDKAGVPRGVVFDAEGFPRMIENTSCIVYYNMTSGKYHTDQCRYAKSAKAINIYCLPAGASGCQSCHPPEKTELPKWAVDYRRYIELKKNAGLPDPDIPAH